jgi:hypothetical protein
MAAASTPQIHPEKKNKSEWERAVPQQESETGGSRLPRSMLTAVTASAPERAPSVLVQTMNGSVGGVYLIVPFFCFTRSTKNGLLIQRAFGIIHDDVSHRAEETEHCTVQSEENFSNLPWSVSQAARRRNQAYLALHQLTAGAK